MPHINLNIYELNVPEWVREQLREALDADTEWTALSHHRALLWLAEAYTDTVKDVRRMNWMEAHPDEARDLMTWMADDAEGTLREECDKVMGHEKSAPESTPPSAAPRGTDAVHTPNSGVSPDGTR